MRQDLPTQIFTNLPSPLSSVEAQKLWLEFLQLKISLFPLLGQHKEAFSRNEISYSTSGLGYYLLSQYQ